MTVTESDVYSKLSLTIGKTLMELVDELAEQYKKEPAIGTVWVHMTSLQHKGYAEQRERQLSAEQLRERLGRSSIEYLLTSDGYRKRDEYSAHDFSGKPVHSS